MLEHAFERLGCLRVELKTDARNERSRGAMAALPAQFEGVHRKHMLVRGGERRDSAWYSVLDDEWPAVRGESASPARPLSDTLHLPGIRQRNWSHQHDRESSRDRRWTRRVGDRRTPAGARRGPRRRRPGARPALRPGPGDRGGRRGDRRPGPWVAHVSGATPLAALEPHERRFGLHPLQTFTRDRGAEQLDGAWAAITAETDEARAGRRLARTRCSASSRSSSPTTQRATYHAGAAIASNYLVTLRRAAGSLLEAAGAPPEALDPLMRRTIENGFELTGPIERGDWATVDAHVARDPRRARPSSSRCTRRSQRRRRRCT